MSEFITKDEILQAEDLQTEDVLIPEWGGKKVRMIGLNAADAQKFSKGLVTMDNKGRVQKFNVDTVMTDLLVLTMVDGNNQPLFTKADIEALGKKSAAVLARLFEVAQRLSGLGEKAAAEIKENLT